MRFEFVSGMAACSLVSLGALALPATAQSVDQPEACSASAYRQFDFWLGEWEVTNPQGAVVGTNSITSIRKGCVLHEYWKGSSGTEGESFNIYDFQRSVWHQTWVDDAGTLLRLEGGLDTAGKMVLRGETVGSDGQAVLNEIAWEPLDSGSVRQVWRTSTDGGETWGTVFDGLYSPKR